MSPLRLLSATAMLQFLLACGPRNDVNARNDSTDGRGDDATTYTGNPSANPNGTAIGRSNGAPVNSNTPTGQDTAAHGNAAHGLGAGGDINRNAGLGVRDTGNTATGTQG